MKQCDNIPQVSKRYMQPLEKDTALFGSFICKPHGKGIGYNVDGSIYHEGKWLVGDRVIDEGFKPKPACTPKVSKSEIALSILSPTSSCNRPCMHRTKSSFSNNLDTKIVFKNDSKGMLEH